jgi:DNA recombination-dependent growth factor C
MKSELPKVTPESILEFVDDKYVQFLNQVTATTEKIDELIMTVNNDTLFQAHRLEHKIHQSRVLHDELDRDCEQLYSKMLRASAERDRSDLKKVNPAKVLSLISKQA